MLKEIYSVIQSCSLDRFLIIIRGIILFFYSWCNICAVAKLRSNSKKKNLLFIREVLKVIKLGCLVLCIQIFQQMRNHNNSYLKI